ncbi:MAG: hypothetical protein LBR79_01165 [Oscillospiraceae bacterium]|nr:hypothetical protein [Oscillospiraceae bacterium]
MANLFMAMSIIRESLIKKWSCLKIVEIPSFPPACGGGGKIVSINLDHYLKS